MKIFLNSQQIFWIVKVFGQSKKSGQAEKFRSARFSFCMQCINAYAYVSVDVDEVDAEVVGDVGVDDTAEVDVSVRNDALRATWRLVGKLGRGHHRILSDQVFAKQRN